MATPEFDITIGKDGQVKVRISGASGDQCMQLADLIAEIVGHEKNREKTAEYYGPPMHVRLDAAQGQQVKARRS